MTPRLAMKLVDCAHSLDDGAEALSMLLAHDGRFVAAQHASLLRLVKPQNAREGMCILYDIADRYGLVPRPYTDADLDDDLPF